MAVIRNFPASDSMSFGRQKISRDVFQVLQRKADLIVGWRALRDLPEIRVGSDLSRFSARVVLMRALSCFKICCPVY